jgi:hypothetical protein
MNIFLFVISSEVKRSREILGTAFGMHSEFCIVDSSTPLRSEQSDKLSGLEVRL